MEVHSYRSTGGAVVYQIPLAEFPELWGHVYLVLADDPHLGAMQVLIDTGSGFGDSNLHLESGLKAVAELSGRPVGFETLTHILITHGHIDHFGGLEYVKARSPAKIGVHELDRRVITNYEERLIVVSRRLDEFLIEAGLPAEKRQHVIQLYKITKSLHHSVKVDFTYEAIGMQLGPFRFLHTPGHCAGHVVIRLDDILFSGDHILEHTSPHQSPEHLTLSTGLEHYLRSLESLRLWAGGIRMTLGGHEEPILNLEERIQAIIGLHLARLDKTLDLLSKPCTVAEVSLGLFGEVYGYNVLLALEEAGAHVEYLYQRGLLGIANLADLDSGGGHTPIRYYRLEN
jgi:glyoxylase-like metal-dependent hydrolase (beta-lactamase superfamily II)